MKAPRWLTEAFRDGVDERETLTFDDGLAPVCWLAQFDRGQRPCEGPVLGSPGTRPRVRNGLRA
jgi:hypothetical protein